MKNFFWWWIFLPVLSWAQTDAWVYLHDKPDAFYFFTHPRQMLSQRALDRRARYGIPLDMRDIPIDETYYSQIKNTPGIFVAGHSKWLNALHVQGDSAAIASLRLFAFVDSIVYANKYVLSRPEQRESIFEKAKTEEIRYTDYGNDTVPYTLHNAFGLHQAGYTGQNVLIAVIDAGFNQADTSAVLQHVYARNGVVDTYNFPDDTSGVYFRHWHGTTVWEVIAGYEEGELVGTAYDADFCLYISEDVYMEMPVEETWWVMAAERADSVGVDVINTSLGYIDFDNHAYDHTWDELDGHTAFASRGAQIATEKGIHVVNSAGNAGHTAWRKISVPADARDVIAVGAVDENGERAFFSSTGNTADGRIKPDVMSWGLGVKTYYNGQYVNLSGTSFSSPLIAGFMADLVQAYPYVPPVEMKEFLLRSSDRYFSPDSLYGYGIPDFSMMMQTLDSAKEIQLQEIRIYPNPFSDNIFVTNLISPLPYALYNINGQLIRRGNLSGMQNFKNLSAGIYILIITDKYHRRIFKLIKQ